MFLCYSLKLSPVLFYLLYKIHKLDISWTLLVTLISLRLLNNVRIMHPYLFLIYIVITLYFYF